MPNFATLGFKWGSSSPGTSAGIVTWAYDPSFSPYFVATIKAALGDWALVSNITFKQVSSLALAQLDFVRGPIDGANGAAVAYGGATSISTGTPLNIEKAGQVVFDSADIRADGTYTTATQPPDNTLYIVALHEIGHAIGLAHYTGAPAIMDGTTTTYTFNTLQPSDIDGARYLYGAKANDAVFRFFDKTTGDHFYTSNPYEQSAIRQNLGSMAFEAAPWAAPAKSDATTDVFRFFDTKSGSHLLTTDANERDVIMQTLPSFTYEGVAFQAYSNPSQAGALTLDRFFNTATGQHHFAGSASESAGIKAGAAGANWVFEGAGLIVHQPVDTLIV